MASPVSIAVEHPQQTQRFEIVVASSATVRDVKDEISRTCPGNPEAGGQRLICKGRILKDAETIEGVWSEEEVKVVHLAVNPYAWTTTPAAPEEPIAKLESPSDLTTIQMQLRSLERQTQEVDTLRDQLASRQRQTSSAFATPSQFERPMGARQPPSNITSESATLPFFNTLPFIRRLHYKALRALSVTTPSPPDEGELPLLSKEIAKSTLGAMGLHWSPIFDADFPDPTDGGVVYEFTMVAGKPYLQNLTPHNIPTPRQRHALNVLAATFPLLTLSIPPALAVSDPNWPLLEQLPRNNEGGAVRFRFGINVNGRQRALNLRFVFTPLLLLALRTLILLYFFSPARKPVFGVIVGAYVLYEAWGALRGAMNEEIARNPEPEGRNGDNHIPLGDQGRMPAQAGAGGDGGRHARAIAATFESAINNLAQMNFDNEARWLDNGGPEPSFFTKAWTFVSLFVLSLHPGFWNRRRAALRTREGVLRTEANATEAALAAQQTEGEGEVAGDENARRAREQLIARHGRRPMWVREYVERVRQGDWVDD